MSRAATAITVFHPGEPGQEFDAWLAALVDSARAAVGFVRGGVSEHVEAVLDPAISVTFAKEQALNDWLDGPARRAVLADGAARGFWPRSSDLVLVEGARPPDGIAVFEHDVATGHRGEFVAAQARIAGITATFAGAEGTMLFGPTGDDDRWMSVLRFRRPHQLSAWLTSDNRAAALTGVRANLASNFTESAFTTPFGSTVRTGDDGTSRVTPGWKAAMLVLLVLYPTVMLLSRFLEPALDALGAKPWLAFFVSNAVSVAALQWLVMPTASRAFRRWLDPIDGAGWRPSLAGAVAVVIGYAAMLFIFASVKELQFWDYGD